MKKIVYTLAFLISSTTFASDMPAYMKDAVITVTLKDGKQYTFPANEYKVVSRNSQPPSEPERVSVPKKELTRLQELDERKNILSVEFVYGNKGQRVVDSASQVEVETSKQEGFGVQYQRRFADKMYLGVRVDTLGTVGGSLGVGF